MSRENSDRLAIVNELLKAGFLTEPTKRALQKRLEKTGSNRFFNDYDFGLLAVICDLLMDQDSNDRKVDIALFIDERLYKNECDGWRYDRMPPDRVMYQLGLKGVDETADLIYKTDFISLSEDQQADVLTQIQKGVSHTEAWEQLSSKLFFEELLAETAEIFFSHPTVQASINYVGMADAKGWTKLKLNETENLENNY